MKTYEVVTTPGEIMVTKHKIKNSVQVVKDSKVVDQVVPPNQAKEVGSYDHRDILR